MKNRQEMFDEMFDLFCELKDDIRRENPHLYERWKAGGFLVDTDIMSMYPNLQEVITELDDSPKNEEDL